MFEIKYEYKLELKTPETMKLFDSTKTKQQQQQQQQQKQNPEKVSKPKVLELVFSLNVI